MALLGLPFRVRRSGGVAVTPGVYRLIAAGNAARDRRDWAASAAAFARALDRDPRLAHIWVQLGHARKEAGDLTGAVEAYREAARRADIADPHLHLGHAAKLRGDHAAAGRHYLDAFAIDPLDADILAELRRALSRSRGADRTAMIEALGRAPEPDGTGPAAVPLGERRTPVPADAGPTLVYDVSDLISYFALARLPTGIQRVQIEAIRHALGRHGRDIRICCFTDGRTDWIEIAPDTFLALAELSVAGGDRGDPAWVLAINRLYVSLALAPPFELPDGACLVNLGTSWWLQNYFLYVREAKARHGIRYIPFVHDLIPIVAPEHCVVELTRDFISWAVGVFEHADHFLVNSEATKRDLLKVADMLGYTLAPSNIATVRLDADFRHPPGEPLRRADLSRWGLEHEPYVLFVSTIESRKNHVGAFDAWLDLIARHGPANVPKLVCVGGRGWLNEEVYQRLRDHPALAERVAMLSRLPDAELDLLYRHALFTLYPSLYEGWGLPVTESLCYGKVPVLSAGSSLPEAGGAFGVYVTPRSVSELADAVEGLAFDAERRAALEARIAAEFRPRSWSDIADQIGREIDRLAAGSSGPAPVPVPLAVPGRYHGIARTASRRIWRGLRSGEAFRSGLGWHWPGAWGCWTRPEGGELTIGLPPSPGGLLLYVGVRGLPDQPSRYTLRVDDGRTLVGELQPDERRWLPVACGEGVRRLRVEIIGERVDGVALEMTGDDPHGPGVLGFYLSKPDPAARAEFVEALATGTLALLDAYGDPAPPAVAQRAPIDAPAPRA